MAEDKSNSPVTPVIARQHKGNPRRHSTGQASIVKSEENAVPHYLRASTGSCHDLCKYGIKHGRETTRTFMQRRVPSRLHDDPILVKSVELPSGKSALARRPNSLSSSKSLNLDSSGIIRKHLSLPGTKNKVENDKKKILVESALLPGRKSKLATMSKVAGPKSLKVDAATNVSQRVKQQGSTPVRQNSAEAEGSAERKEKSVKLKSLLGLKTHSSGSKETNKQKNLSSYEASKQVPLKVKERRLSGMHSTSANRNHMGLKHSPPSITPIRLNKKSSSDGAADRIKGSSRRISAKNVMGPQSTLMSSNSSVRKIPSLTGKNCRTLKGISHERSENQTKNIEAVEMDNEEVPDKTLYAINMKDESEVSYFEATANTLMSYNHNQNGASIVSPTASHHSAIESASSGDPQSVSFRGDSTEQAKYVTDEKASTDAISIAQPLSSLESLSLENSHFLSLYEEGQVEQAKVCINNEKASIDAISIPQPLSLSESLTLGDSHSSSFHEKGQVEQAKFCVSDEKAGITAISIPQPLSSPQSLSHGESHSISSLEENQVEQAKLCANDEKASIDAISIPQPLSSHEENQVEQAKLCTNDEKASIDAISIPQLLSSHVENQVEPAKLCTNDEKASIDAISIPRPLSSPESLSLGVPHSSSLQEEDKVEVAKSCINDEKARTNAISIPQPLSLPESLSLGDSHSSSSHGEDQVELAGSHDCSQSERNSESSPSHPNSCSLSSSHEGEKEEEAEEEEEEEEEELESVYSISVSEDFSISDTSDMDVLEETEILEDENKGEAKKFGFVYMKDHSISDSSDMDVLGKNEILEGENKVKAKKSGVVYTKDVDGKPVKLHFRRGKVVEIHTENNAPTRLKFRQGRVLDPNEIEIVKADAQRKSMKRREETDGDNDGTKLGSRRIVLRRKYVQEKKDSKGLFNNVIEETASKLVETRKSKVKALVGAFETVISLQDTKPSAS